MIASNEPGKFLGAMQTAVNNTDRCPWVNILDVGEEVIGKIDSLVSIQQHTQIGSLPYSSLLPYLPG